MSRSPSRGEVWWVDLNPIRGREQAGHRPALVLSVDKFNHGPAELVIAIPMTKKDKGIVTHVRVDPPAVPDVGFIKCEDLRSLSKDRFHRQLGSVDSKTMAEVQFAICALLGF